jgi:hypothetical protein
MNNSRINFTVCEILCGCLEGCHYVSIFDGDLLGELDDSVSIFFSPNFASFLLCLVTKINQAFVAGSCDILSYGSHEDREIN